MGNTQRTPPGGGTDVPRAFLGSDLQLRKGAMLSQSCERLDTASLGFLRHFPPRFSPHYSLRTPPLSTHGPRGSRSFPFGTDPAPTAAAASTRPSNPPPCAPNPCVAVDASHPSGPDPPHPLLHHRMPFRSTSTPTVAGGCLGIGSTPPPLPPPQPNKNKLPSGYSDHAGVANRIAGQHLAHREAKDGPDFSVN